MKFWSLAKSTDSKCRQDPSENLSTKSVGSVCYCHGKYRNKVRMSVRYTPAEGYKWNNLADCINLLSDIRQFDLSTATRALRPKKWRPLPVDQGLSDQNCFEAGQRDWATTKAQWPGLYQYHHASFTNFRTKTENGKGSTALINKRSKLVGAF